MIILTPGIQVLMALPKNEKRRENIRKNSWKCSYRFFDSSFSNPAEKNFLAWGRNFFAHCHRTLKNRFSLKTKIFPQVFPWTRRKQKNENSFRIDISPENDPIDTENAVFATLPKRFCHSGAILPFNVKNRLRKSISPATKHVFLKRLHRTRITQFWQPCRNFWIKD